MMFIGRQSCWAVVVILGNLWIGSPWACAAEPAARPNFLIVLADDLGYSDLGCYGGEIETPRLDALAAHGLRFTQFHNTARCWPTRGALLTGYYAQQIRRDAVPGIRSGGQGVRPSWARLLPDDLRAAGYRSYHVGKWHVDGKPLAAGFDRSYYVQDQGRYFHPRVRFLDDQPLPAVPRDSGYYATVALADRTIEFLQEHHAQHRQQPFFCYLAFSAPHFPLHALPDDIDRYRQRYRAGWDRVRAERWQRIRAMGLVGGDLSPVERDVGPPYDFPQAIAALGPGEINRPLPWDDLTAEQQDFQATKMAIHAAMIDRLDRELGRVLDQLQRMQVFDNTVVCFLSDNGASAEIMVRDDGHDPAAPPGSAASYLCLGPGWSNCANTPFRRHKTWVHQGGIATPLIVHWPRGIRTPGELRHTPGHVIDLVPTIVALAGLDAAAPRPLPTAPPRPLPPAPPRPGRDLQSLFAADADLNREFLWWLHEDNRALRQGNWKLVQAATSPHWELFDLGTDPTEAHDLAAQFPDRVAEMSGVWQAKLTQFTADATREPVPAASEPATKKTKAKRLSEKGSDPPSDRR